ncbi:Spy0128 family protein [Oribacterium sp. HCP3S3_B9]|uniref:Spy0128 family protein n=1 Tax=Oribacterium sp. HCP3S3_B9 TaxID=3438946 RepID=UPI003F8C780A
MGITTVALLAMQTVTAFASVESYSQTKLGSITITPGDQDHKGAAVDADEAGTYTLYRVGDVVDGSSVTEFTLAKDFAGSGVTIDRESLNSAELPKTLAKYAEDHSITALKDDIKSGEEVGELEIGLYLVKQKTVHVAWHSFSPFLVIMPEAVEGGYEYEVKAMPKTWKLSTAKLDPPVRKVITDQYGNSITSDEKFEFVMTPSADAPMPEGTAAGTPKTVTAGAGEIEFGEISYTTVGGPYVYTFTEKAGSNARWTYDDSVYTMTVNVIRNAEDKLEAQKTITKNGAEVSIVEFKNSYRKSSGGGGGSSSGGGPKGDPSTDPNGPTGKPTVEPEGEVGRVLGAVRDKLADTPVGRVLGASRRAKTGDESSMRTYGAVFGGAVVLLAAWGVTYKKKKRHTNEA